MLSDVASGADQTKLWDGHTVTYSAKTNEMRNLLKQKLAEDA